jgi:hypothetical protein
LLASERKQKIVGGAAREEKLGLQVSEDKVLKAESSAC